jgi:hypothetical protein
VEAIDQLRSGDGAKDDAFDAERDGLFKDRIVLQNDDRAATSLLNPVQERVEIVSNA